MLEARVYVEPTAYLVIVNHEENTYEYRWGKEIPDGQSLEDYLQMCKREALLLTENELAQNLPSHEIVI